MTSAPVTRLRTSEPETDVDDVPPSHVHRRRLLVIAAAAVVLVVFAVWLVAFSPVFGARSVDVSGARLVTAAQIRTVADVEHGAPLVRLDTAAITRRVETIPGIASAQVSTSFPSTVTITVVERQPVGYVKAARGSVLVDSTGAQYRTVSATPKNLPRFVLPTGSQARSTAVALGRVAAALSTTLRAQVTSIQSLDPDSVTLTVKGGVLVRWGSADRSTDKARVLPALLKRHTDLVDLTDPDQPYVR